MDWNTLTDLSIAFLFIALTAWHIRGLILLMGYESKILELKNKTDTMMMQLSKNGYPVAQSVLEGRTERANKPLLDEMDTLKLKRQFLLDKLPLLGFFKFK